MTAPAWPPVAAPGSRPELEVVPRPSQPAGPEDLTDAEYADHLASRPALASAATEPTLLDKLRSRLLTSEDLDALPPPRPLIDGVLWADSLIELWGKPGCGKSFVAMDWALSVATGKPWQGHDVQPGRVLYIVGEGLAGLGKRRRAWSYAWHQPRTDDITWLQGAVPLMAAGWTEALAQLVAETEPVLIVVDTLSRAIAGHNENAPETMSAVVAASDRIRQAANGACVLFVHHATKDGATNRGHSALEGACDVRWKLANSDDDGALVLSNPKAKDEAEAPDRPLGLRVIDLPGGERSCIVESHGRTRSAEEDVPSQSRLLQVMRDSFGTTGATGTQLREAAALHKTTHYRALNDLLGRGALLNTGTRQRPFFELPTVREAQ